MVQLLSNRFLDVMEMLVKLRAEEKQRSGILGIYRVREKKFWFH